MEEKFYCIEVNIETRAVYNERVHKSFEFYKIHCIDGDFGLRRQDIIIKKVFRSFSSALKFAECIKGVIKFEKYTVLELGAACPKEISSLPMTDDLYALKKQMRTCHTR